MTYRFTPIARQELADAIDWYLEEAGPEVSARFEQAIDRSLNLLVDRPSLGTPKTTVLRAWPLRRFPYVVIYAPDATGIRVVAIAHQSRHPRRWLGRS